MLVASGRPMRFREYNVYMKKRFYLNIGLVYPSTYQASLSSLGYQAIYYMLNEHPEIFAERIVSVGENPAKSIERGTPAKRFPILLASLSYELDYPTLINVLRSSGIPVKRESRSGDDPLIIAGGAAITANPNPLYDVVDAVVRGEAEEVIPELAEVLLENIGVPRERLLDELAGIEGIWVPSLKEEHRIRITSNLDGAFHPIRQIQNPDVEPVFGRALMVEPSRGCNRGCSFCMEASITSYRRERSFNTLKAIIEKGLELNRLKRVAFYTLSFFDSGLGERLLEFLVDRGVEASVPSVRADALTHRRIELIRLAGQKTLTIAPETPVFHLQRVLRKHISEDKILEVAEDVGRLGMNLKLYYMIGVPGESIEDVEEIVNQVRRVHGVIRDRRRIRISINPLIPKPATILWGKRILDKRELKKRISFLKRELSRFATRVDTYPVGLAYFQYEVNRRGKDALPLIIEQADKVSPHLRALRASRAGVEELG